MDAIDNMKWNVAVLNIDWRADRHDESHSIEFEVPTADNPTPEYPVERTKEWEACYVEVEQECDRRLGDTPRGMGFCFAYWSIRSEVLDEHGINWRSPHQMNPRVMFD